MDLLTEAAGAGDLAAILVDTGTTLQADTDDIQARLPAALVGGRIDSSVGAMAAGVVTATAVATGAIDADALAADAVDEIWDELMVEPSQAAPGAAPALRTVLAYLYVALRNAITVSATSKTFSDDSGTVIFKKALSDDSTTYTEAEAVSGP